MRYYKDEKKYYFHAYKGTANHAGSKAVSDCEIIMSKLGYKGIPYGLAKSSNKIVARIQKALSEIYVFGIPSGSTLVVEHPIYINRNYLTVLSCLKKIRKVKLVFIIHDLESIRNLLPDSDVYATRDYQMYEIADFIVAHNDAMKKYLVEHCNVSEKKIIELGIFDYLSNQDVRQKRENSGQIAIAGNLSEEKSGYIYSLLNRDFEVVSLNLYGVNFNEKLCKRKAYQYKGSFDANELSQRLEGAYGLVWDGSSVDSCVGNTGNYLKYNNPHKVSLYIAARMPIIIWKKAALAKFVTENRIGIAIDSLADLDKEVRAVDKKKYKEFLKNLDKLSYMVSNGMFLTNALQKVNL